MSRGEAQTRQDLEREIFVKVISLRLRSLAKRICIHHTLAVIPRPNEGEGDQRRVKETTTDQ